ncbi:MAG: methyltransferase domain-containing protein [Reyranellaceae bacterium]
MTTQQIRFDDGAAYERMMGAWSRLAGEVFLDWLAPASGLRWVDVGCGNGAFTELLFDRCAPSAVDGVDPSEGQLDFARRRLAGRLAKFHRGDALQLPFVDRDFDAAVMALVIFFVPDPAKGVAEMVRVAKPGGLVAAYAWDMLGGGFTQEPIQAEMRAIGLKPVMPPRAEASRIEALSALWEGAGLEDVETREIPVSRTFANFEEYWTTSLAGTTGQTIAALPATEAEGLKARVRDRLPADADGHVVCKARANAVQGRVRKLRAD